MCLQEMPVVFVVSMPFTMSLFACAMISHSGFMNLHSKCTSSTVILFFSQSIMWASVSVPTDSVPTTQSPKREVGTIALWPQARARPTVILLPHLHLCLLSMERDLVCNTPCMLVSVVGRHSSHPRPCHFAHTRHNLCSS